jgi:glycosyltransferase involved in cell wall biosynthesis
VSETFVINEILAIESFDQPVSIFSLHHPPAQVAHGILEKVRAPLYYVEDIEADEEEVAKARRWLGRSFGIEREERDRYLPRKYVRLALGLARLGVESGIGHFHAHFASRSGHVTALAARLIGVPYSITAHAKDIYHCDVDQELLRWKIAHAKFVVTVTDYNLRHLRTALNGDATAKEKVVRVYNGVDLSRFDASPGEPKDEPVLLAIGRLVEKKGFHVLVDACRQLLDRGYRFRCEIIGGGDLESELRAQIADRKIDDVVTLAGSMTTEAVSTRLRDAAVVVLPCIVGGDGNVDALPTVLLEAMATGRPLVSTRLSGIPEIVEHERNGLLVEPGEVTALADALARLLDDPERAVEMGRAGRALAQERFDLYKNAAEVRARILESAVTEGGA